MEAENGDFFQVSCAKTPFSHRSHEMSSEMAKQRKAFF